ncbi:MAG: hypothetical protein VCE91_04445 [Nitrospinota bacterium]
MPSARARFRFDQDTDHVAEEDGVLNGCLDRGHFRVEPDPDLSRFLAEQVFGHLDEDEQSLFFGTPKFSPVGACGFGAGNTDFEFLELLFFLRKVLLERFCPVVGQRKEGHFPAGLQRPEAPQPEIKKCGQQILDPGTFGRGVHAFSDEFVPEEIFPPHEAIFGVDGRRGALDAVLPVDELGIEAADEPALLGVELHVADVVVFSSVHQDANKPLGLGDQLGAVPVLAPAADSKMGLGGLGEHEKFDVVYELLLRRRGERLSGVQEASRCGNGSKRNQRGQDDFQEIFHHGYWIGLIGWWAVPILRPHPQCREEKIPSGRYSGLP